MPFFEESPASGGARRFRVAPRVKGFVVGVVVKRGELDSMRRPFSDSRAGATCRAILALIDLMAVVDN